LTTTPDHSQGLKNLRRNWGGAPVPVLGPVRRRRAGMDINVYLPDELGKWAKDHDLPCSRIFRYAVDGERQRGCAGRILRLRRRRSLRHCGQIFVKWWKHS
jgi:hypothetical protein